MRECFPKSVRLRTPSEFRFRPYTRVNAENFAFIFTKSGSGRLGLSLTKKVLPRAVARNRVRRLLREGFRKNINKFKDLDVNILARPQLKETWKGLSAEDVSRELSQFAEGVR